MRSASAPGDSSPRRSIDRVQWVLRFALGLVLVAALVALAVHVGLIHKGSQASGGGSYIDLRGSTEEQQPISVTLDHHGRIQALHVQLIGLCENGGRQSIGWSPDSPRIPFQSNVNGIVAHEYGEQRSAIGIVSHTVVGTTAHVVQGGGSAAGDVRYQTTFRYPDGHQLRCDSGYVRWGVNRTGTANGAESAGPPGSFPPVSSLAAAAPPGQLRFASEVDKICAVTYNENQVRELRRLRAHEASISRREAGILDHERQYIAIDRLGPPPSAPNLYGAWLTNMLGRIKLEWLALRQRAQGKTRRSEITLAEVSFMKVRGDSLGQEFGLRLCTSNGPLRN